MNKVNNITRQTLKIFAIINFLTTAPFVFSTNPCYASDIYDENRTPQSKENTTHRLQETYINLEKLKKASIVVTPMDDFIQIYTADPKEKKPVIIFKNYLSAVKIRSIFFEGLNPGKNEIKDFDLVLARIAKAEVLKFHFNAKTLVLRINHMEHERSTYPMIINDYHLTIQMQLVENHMQGGL